MGGNSIVFALTSFNGDLIAGGQFAMAGGIAGTPGIARWNGAWAAVRSGMRPTQTGDSSPRAVFALAPSFAGDLLYAGGFCQVESVPLAPGYLMGYHFVP